MNDTRCERSNPGWLARFLFWAAILLGYLPALIVLPLMSSGDPVLIGIYAGANLIAGILRLLLGTAALLLVKQTSWTRRLIAGGIFLLACLYSLVVVPFTPLIIESLAGGVAGSAATPGFVFSIQSAILLALMFVAWNVARNRRWWVLLIAVVWAGVCAGATALVQTILGSGVSVSAGLNVVIQLSTAVLTFLSLGLFHLLGRIRGASVPPLEPKPQPAGQWGPLPPVGGSADWPQR